MVCFMYNISYHKLYILSLLLLFYIVYFWICAEPISISSIRIIETNKLSRNSKAMTVFDNVLSDNIYNDDVNIYQNVY